MTDCIFIKIFGKGMQGLNMRPGIVAIPAVPHSGGQGRRIATSLRPAGIHSKFKTSLNNRANPVSNKK